MLPTDVDRTLAQLLTGNVANTDLLACARWAGDDPERLRQLRSAWPAVGLPTIDRYFCVSRLGQGASGTVYRTLEVSAKPRLVALKILQSSSSEAEQRFREREIAILKNLDCPYVARHLDSGVAGDATYLVMELVDGLPIDEYLVRHEGDVERQLTIFQRLCSVVAGFHARGVSHRDLKPKHVLVDDNDQPWVVDFGLSAARGEDWPSRVLKTQTELGRVFGTIKYMSPEQAWGGLLPVDQRCDIWSLGVMLFEIATGGNYPYDLDPLPNMTRSSALLHRIQTEMPRPPRIRDSEYAESLATLIGRCLTPEAEHRLASAEQLAIDLERCLAREPIRTRRLPVRYRFWRIFVGLSIHRRAGLWLGVVSAVLLLIFTASILLDVKWIPSANPIAVGETVGVAGISDASLEAVPKLAGQLDVPGVSTDIRTWRGIHGHLMERLAAARPRAVVWDYYFRSEQAGDPAFARGATALHEAGIPVVLAVRNYNAEGRPDLSASLFGPLASHAHHGLILARDMVLREGEFVVALRRADQVYPALVLAAFAAATHPECRAMVDWAGPAATELQLVFHGCAGDDPPPRPARIPLAKPIRLTTANLSAQAGDEMACAAFSLRRPGEWDRQLVPYEHLLSAPPSELQALVGGKVLVIGDVRSARPFFAHDRKRVRYGAEVIDNVPGCYLMADAIRGLLARRFYTVPRKPTHYAFVGAAALAMLACVAGPHLARSRLFDRRAARLGVPFLLVAAATASLGIPVVVRQVIWVHAGLFGAAACLALTGALAIEFARNRYRVASQPGLEAS